MGIAVLAEGGARSACETPDRGWRVMVVEDNHAVAALHRRIVDLVPYLKTAHVAWNGEHAARALEAVRPDLVILDLTMPGGGGLPFLRRIRQEGIPIDVIVVTASRDGPTVNEAMQLGAVDYLVKPFSPQRLRQSLSAFAVRRRTLTGRSELRQADVDAVQASALPRQRRRLPKGLKEATLKSVLAALRDAGDAISAEEAGTQVGVARVTARRYLEYLVLMGVAEMSRETKGPGRPRNRYRLRSSSRR
jgi:two-component system response regulator DctR